MPCLASFFDDMSGFKKLTTLHPQPIAQPRQTRLHLSSNTKGWKAKDVQCNRAQNAPYNIVSQESYNKRCRECFQIILALINRCHIWHRFRHHSSCSKSCTFMPYQLHSFGTSFLKVASEVRKNCSLTCRSWASDCRYKVCVSFFMPDTA